MSDTKDMSRRQARREQMRRKEQRGKLMGVGLTIIGAAFLAFLFIYPNFKPAGSVSTPDAFSRPNVKFNAAGNPDAPIKIEEYSDFQCPYCGRFAKDTEPQLFETYVADGTVYFVYHSFGDFIGPESRQSAQAAYCAGDQEKFWEMHDTIFANQSGENAGAFTDRRLVAFAEKLELDMNTFNTCFDGNKYKDLIDQDAKDGLAAGVQGTPGFVMTYVNANGEEIKKLIEGALPFDSFKQEIEAALTAIGQ